MASKYDIEPTRRNTGVVGLRIVAQVIDGIALFLVLFVGISATGGALVNSAGEPAVGAIFLGSIAAAVLYGTVLEGYWNGQTIGKRMVGIKVVDRDGSSPSVGQAFVRNLPATVRWIGLITGLVALASMASSDLRQRVFDGVAGTYVVRNRASAGSDEGLPSYTTR